MPCLDFSFFYQRRGLTKMVWQGVVKMWETPYVGIMDTTQVHSAQVILHYFFDIGSFCDMRDRIKGYIL